MLFNLTAANGFNEGNMDKMNCAFHPEIEACGACCNCGRFICSECKAVIVGRIYCNRCVEDRLNKGYWTGQDASKIDYTAQTGAAIEMPPEIRGWNWGAFLLTWIWGIGNNVWISLLTLLSIIPYVGWLIMLAMRIILGIKGNEWAWKNKKWQSVEHFKQTQRKWAWWGLGFILLYIALMLAVAVLLFSLFMIGISVDEYFDWRKYLPL